jgi:hypothetical protein
MALTKNVKHPSFVIGAISFLLLLVGVIVKAGGYRGGDYIIIASVVFGFIHWIWSIADVAKSKHLDERKSPFLAYNGSNHSSTWGHVLLYDEAEECGYVGEGCVLRLSAFVIANLLNPYMLFII